jgi:hypothetical protein
MVGEAVNPELIKRRMWLDYQRACTDPLCERLGCVHELMDKLVDPELDLHKFLQDAVDLIRARLYINKVTIGLKNQDDGIYRYEVMAGLEESEWKAHLGLSYVYDQFVSQDVYKYEEISKHTRLYLAEDNPYANGEDQTYSRELMLQSKRRSLEDTIEGDYIDTLVFGKKDDLIGWIEFSGMSNGKFPDGQTIRCIELMASVVAIAISLLGSR